jgi:hypothetical protein
MIVLLFLKKEENGSQAFAEMCFRTNMNTLYLVTTDNRMSVNNNIVIRYNIKNAIQLFKKKIETNSLFNMDFYS